MSIKVKEENVIYQQGRLQTKTTVFRKYLVLKNGYEISMSAINIEITNRKPTTDWYKIRTSKSDTKKIEYFKKHIEDNFIKELF